MKWLFRLLTILALGSLACSVGFSIQAVQACAPDGFELTDGSYNITYGDEAVATAEFYPGTGIMTVTDIASGQLTFGQTLPVNEVFSLETTVYLDNSRSTFVYDDFFTCGDGNLWHRRGDDGSLKT